MSENEDSYDIEFTGTLNRLTSIVREQYKSNLSKAIRENYSNCVSLEPAQAEKYVDRWTNLYEQKAIDACMIAQFYRQEMLNFMNQIKQSTKKGQLLPCDTNISEEPESSAVLLSPTTSNKSTQTEKESALLTDKDIKFLKEFRRNQRKRPKKESKTEIEKASKKLSKAIPILQPISVPPPLPPDRMLDIFDDPFISEENLEFHLSAMFSDQPSGIELNSYQSKSESLKEPSESVEKMNIELSDGYDPEIRKLLLDIEENNRLLKSRSEQQNLPAESPHTSIDDIMIMENTRKELMKSIWPCKLYHHRKELKENVLILVERDCRSADIIKQKFSELFGDDSDDDIGAFSPSHDMDSELLLSSSKKRVAPMVVQNLMDPFKKGLIGDKIAFKSMAQDFTECIVANDLYPSLSDVKQVIEGYFDDTEVDINALLK